MVTFVELAIAFMLDAARHPSRALQRHKVKAFRDWLLAEIAGEAPQ
jgi:hypothetical protein